MNLILSTLTGIQIDNPRTVIDQGFNPYNQGCLIRTLEVNSISEGTVIAIGQDNRNNTWTITIEVNSVIWLRYCRLSSVNVQVGQSINAHDLLGYAYKKLMRLEYCTPQESNYPVREISNQLYKHDPTPVIFGMINLSEAY